MIFNKGWFKDSNGYPIADVNKFRRAKYSDRRFRKAVKSKWRRL